VVALVTPAAARSRLVVLDRPTLACLDQQALETALTLARLHDGPAFRDHASSYGCMWIEPDNGPLAGVGGAAGGAVPGVVAGAGLFGSGRWARRGHRRARPCARRGGARGEPPCGLHARLSRRLVGKRLACGRVRGETISADRHWPD